jgi:XTP/dITP diphosphohydrolase
MLGGVAVRVVTPRELGVEEEAVEDGETFRANALLKARFFSSRTALPCLADDSGLEVDALGSRPGVYSSRYAPSDAERIARLLEEMREVPEDRRTARFVCAAALVVPPRDTVSPATATESREILEIGTCEGRIARAPRGRNGFGYDPVFLLPEIGRTMAEISPEEKNARSHRSRAIQAMRPHLLRLFPSR